MILNATSIFELADYAESSDIVIALSIAIIVYLSIIILAIHSFKKRRSKKLKDKNKCPNIMQEPAVPDNVQLEKVVNIPTSTNQNVGYTQKDNVITKSDNSTINDDEIPYLIKLGYEQAIHADNDCSTQLNLLSNDSFNEEEKIFFSCLVTTIDSKKLKSQLLRLQKLSDGTFNVYHNTYYIGKIRLSKKNYYMQYLKGFRYIKHLDNPSLLECIQTIPRWITYINYCKRN